MIAEPEPLGRTVALGFGRRAPYPEPTSAAATKIGKANPRRDTGAELALRSDLHRRGLRYRVDLPVRVPGSRPIRPDVVFTRVRIAVFVDGCFWHGCPQHQHVPKSNLDYWVPKLQANVDRDRMVDGVLRGAGWQVLRVWEHEASTDAADRVARAVRSTRPL